MTWWQRLLGGASTGASNRFMYVYVRCARCGAPVRVRVDVYNDAAVEFDASEREIGFIWRKDIVDSKCFRPIHAEITFDTLRRERNRTIVDGTYIDEATYLQLTEPSTNP